jgi:hypothetical protein
MRGKTMKKVAFYTLGCPKVNVNMIALMPCAERNGVHGKKTTNFD